MDILTLLNIETVFFTIWDYPMSYLEFFGTIFTVLSVWYATRNNVLTWPVGIVGVILYIFLFYQINLYSDFLEQIYFLITSFIGWWLWIHPRTKAETDIKKGLKINTNSTFDNIVVVLAIVAGTILMGEIMGNIHVYLPQFFPEPASYPYLDAFTTILSFVATILMAKKRIECWYLWILVDIIGIGLYYVKDVRFIALEYALFLILASKGLLDWRKEHKRYTLQEG
ncbi:MAG: nicotinamide riboside transporter PnuC [archaeon]|mgnify:CR=1 FL=1